MYALVCGSQRLTLSILFYHSLSYYFKKQGLQSNLELINSARLVNQGALGILLSVSLELEIQMCEAAPTFLCKCEISQPRLSNVHVKDCGPRAMSLAPVVSFQ